MRKPSNIQPAEQDVLKAFDKIILGGDVHYKVTEGDNNKYPEISIESNVRIDKSMPIQEFKMELSIHLTDDPRAQLSRRLVVDCSCSIYVDGASVVFVSRISGDLATYIGGCLHDLEEKQEKPAKEAAYKNFQKIIS